MSAINNSTNSSDAVLELPLLGLKQRSASFNALCRGFITRLMCECPEAANWLRNGFEITNKQRSELDKCLTQRTERYPQSSVDHQFFELVVEAYRFKSTEIQECLRRVETDMPISFRKRLIQHAFAKQFNPEHCLRLLEVAERVGAFGDETAIELISLMSHADRRIQHIAAKHVMIKKQAQLQSRQSHEFASHEPKKPERASS